MTEQVRVRFAPSPTGMFHVGGARSALFNWAVAERAGGRFVLRIEDTDTARNRPEWTRGILDALAWIGIGPESPTFEGPYHQSGREERHRAAAEKLHAGGHAYFCDCTREALEGRTGSAQRGYDGFCRDRGLSAGPGRALRFRTPDDGVTVVDDLVRGRVEFANAALDDFVVARADGSALFVLANAVDDLDMGITHVIRGEEHLPNTPKQQLLWSALGAAAPPAWAHLSVIVNERRQKLSKRRDKVALESYRDEGYLSEAMVNYLMLLGWGPGDDTEIMPWEEIVARFRLEDVNAAPAFFDEKKLRAFNGEYLRALPVASFVDRCGPWLYPPRAPWPEEAYDPAVFDAVAPLVQTRITLLSEISSYVDFFFLDAPAIDPASWDKAMTADAPAILRDTLARYEGAPWATGELKSALEEVGAAHGRKLGKAQAPVRVAVTGRTVGLPLFESLEVLGRDRTLARMRAALDRLG